MMTFIRGTNVGAPIVPGAEEDQFADQVRGTIEQGVSYLRSLEPRR